MSEDIHATVDTNGEVHVGTSDPDVIADAHDALYHLARRETSLESGTPADEADDTDDLYQHLGEARKHIESGANPEYTFRLHVSDFATIIGALSVYCRDAAPSSDYDPEATRQAWEQAFAALELRERDKRDPPEVARETVTERVRDALAQQA